MPKTVTINGRRLLEITGNRVFARLAWADPWELKENVHCSGVNWAARPSTGQASLYYRYGRRGGTDDDFLNPFTLPLLAYVKIEIDVFNPDDSNDPLTLFWYGVAGNLVNNRDGNELNDGGDPATHFPTGTQTINCVDMSWLLDRSYVRTSLVKRGEGIAVVSRGLEFNPLATGHSRSLNMETHLINDDETWTATTNIFDDSTDATNWSTLDIVEYLLATQTPERSKEGVAVPSEYPIRWELDDADRVLPIWDEPRLSTHGIATGTLLNQLISRQRGLGYWFDVEPVDGESEIVKLKPFSFTGTDVALANGQTLNANSDSYNLEILGDQSGSLVEVTDAFARYHVARVQGRRVCHCFSIDAADFKLWDNEAAYQVAASNDIDYPPAEEINKRQRQNATARAKDDFTNTYRLFGFSTRWDYLTRDSALALPLPDTIEPVNPSHENTDNSFIPGLKVAERLPLVVGVDYFPPAPDDPPESPVYREPTIYFRRPDDNNSDSVSDSNDPQTYVAGDRISDYATADNVGLYQWTAHIRPATDQPKFYVDVTGQPRHIIDAANFEFLDADVDLGQWDLNQAIITLAVFSDQYCEAAVASKTLPADAVREKLINAGDSYQLNHLADGTVLGLTASGELLQRITGAVYFRDDREELKSIADLAIQWYGVDRKTLTFSTAQLLPSQWDKPSADDNPRSMFIGSFIAQVVDPNAVASDINTVVTSVSIDMSVGADRPAIPKMTVNTSWAELDVLGGA